MVHCNTSGTCTPVTHNSLKFANGLVRGHDGLLYVPQAALPYISVYRLKESGLLEEVDRIVLGMPVDNLSVDAHGIIWAAGMTKVAETMGAVGDPFNRLSPSTIFQIHKRDDGKYETSKVLEDRDKRILSGASTAVHDTTTGRLFIGGMSYAGFSIPRGRRR